MPNKTICFVHGVGNHNPGFSLPLSKKVGEQTGAICIEHMWQHEVEKVPNTITEASGIRSLVGEIILDFAYVVLNFKQLTEALPDADMYVGHSAGSIVIAEKLNKVLLGSPLELFRQSLVAQQIKSFSSDTVTRGTTTTLNIYNPYDPIAFEVENAQNKTLKLKWYQETYYRLNPYAAHTDYWDKDSVATDISRWFKRLAL